VDQDIISLDVPRSAEEAKQSMHFKDSMRERALADIADAWCRVVATYHASSPDTAASVLETVQRYVHWIDIGLVANDTFVPLLFTVLDAPQEHLKGAAADVLTEIVRWGCRAIGAVIWVTDLGQPGAGWPACCRNSPVLRSGSAAIAAGPRCGDRP
jgi:exportin-T